MSEIREKIIKLLDSFDSDNYDLAEMLCKGQNINFEEFIKEVYPYEWAISALDLYVSDQHSFKEIFFDSHQQYLQ